MKTPFEILQIDHESDDEAIRKGYLAMVQQFPPERFPDEFQRVRAAYESIKTEKARIALALFDHSLPDMNEMAADIMARARPGRPTEKQLKRLMLEAVGK